MYSLEQVLSWRKKDYSELQEIRRPEQVIFSFQVWKRVWWVSTFQMTLVYYRLPPCFYFLCGLRFQNNKRYTSHVSINFWLNSVVMLFCQIIYIFVSIKGSLKDYSLTNSKQRWHDAKYECCLLCIVYRRDHRALIAIFRRSLNIYLIWNVIVWLEHLSAVVTDLLNIHKVTKKWTCWIFAVSTSSHMEIQGSLSVMY